MSASTLRPMCWKSLSFTLLSSCKFLQKEISPRHLKELFPDGVTYYMNHVTPHGLRVTHVGCCDITLKSHLQKQCIHPTVAADSL